MNTFILVIEILGTIAFAASGAMTGIQKKMDIFGVTILGLTTAVGGGIIRDILIGNIPPQTFHNPIYATIAIITAIIIFLLGYCGKLIYNTKIYEYLTFIMDSLGLGIFTVVGINTALEASHDFRNFLLVFVGVLTGVGGGVLRDILAGNTPYIFVKHIYACASLAGALVCVYGSPYFGLHASMIAGAVVVVLIRFLSAHYKWNLPRIE
ncbi:MAG: TRIC cation channel family protein [Lachnospiraceae bacterium]|nr:TRIC cation channel family protein [Lachnospiraceae bacterium]